MTDKFKFIKFHFSNSIKILFLLILITAISFSQFNSEQNIGNDIISGKINLKESRINKNPDDDGNKFYNKLNHQFSISIMGGYLLPIGDLKGDVSNVSLKNGATSALSYYEKWGYAYGLTAKMKVDKKNKFRATISLIINNFRNSGSDSSGLYTIEPELNYIQLGLGGEYSFARFNQIVPYVGVELCANSFYGSINFIDDYTGSTFSGSYNTVTRYGFSVGTGADYYISNSWGVFAGIKFSVANLLGKNYDASGLHDLDDESYTINGVSVKQKTISHLSFFAGFSVFIGD